MQAVQPSEHSSAQIAKELEQLLGLDDDEENDNVVRFSPQSIQTAKVNDLLTANALLEEKTRRLTELCQNLVDSLSTTQTTSQREIARLTAEKKMLENAREIYTFTDQQFKNYYKLCKAELVDASNDLIQLRHQGRKTLNARRRVKGALETMKFVSNEANRRGLKN